MVQKPKLPKPMTVITGLICSDAIIFASDSQTTEGSKIRNDVTKIHAIDSNIGEILIGQSGSVEYGNACIEEIKASVCKSKLTIQRDVSEAFEKAVIKVRRKLTKLHRGARIEQAVRDFNVGLLFGFYIDGTPSLWKISFEVPAANRINGHYATIGSGADLAEFLLSQYAPQKTNSNHGCIISILAIERVKSHVSGCGGPTKLASLTPHTLGLIGVANEKIPQGTKQFRMGHLVKYLFPSALLMFEDYESFIKDLAKDAIRIDDQARCEITVKISKELMELAESEKSKLQPTPAET